MIIQLIHSAVDWYLGCSWVNSSVIHIPVQVSWYSSALPSSNLPCKFQLLAAPNFHSAFSAISPVWAPFSCAMGGKVLPDRHGEPGVHLVYFPSLKYQPVLHVIQLLNTAAPDILPFYSLGQQGKSNTNYYVKVRCGNLFISIFYWVLVLFGGIYH